MNEKIDGTTCIYWRAEKCNKNPCRFMHNEIPSPHISYKCVNATYRYNWERSHQELARISVELFHSPCLIRWDETIFRVDNNGVPLYILIQDVLEIIQENQIINIACIQLWMM